MVTSFPVRDEFFIISNKNKLWAIRMEDEDVIIYELNDPLLSSMTMTAPSRDIEVLSYFGKNIINYKQESLAELDLSFKCLPENFKCISSKKDKISPADFYSMGDLAKLSKFITAKIKKVKGNK